MDDFEITIPRTTSFTIDVTNQNLYNYDFNTFSLIPLQKAASTIISNTINKKFFSHISEIPLIKQQIQEGNTKYVAKLSKNAEEKLKNGEWVFGVRKNTGETYGVIRNKATGKIVSNVNLELENVKDLGNLVELSIIQEQLAVITEQIENLNRLVERVEQGQYNDRFAGFFSARQLVIEGLVANDENLKRELLTSAIKSSNDTISKLMLSINQDAQDFIDLKTKPKDAKRIDNLIQNSIGYLNSSVQLNLVAYTAMGEEQSVLATLVNYQSFINQTLLKKDDKSGKTVAWKIDNVHKGVDGKFNKLSNDISMKITALLENAKNTSMKEIEYEEVETKTLQDT